LIVTQTTDIRAVAHVPGTGTTDTASATS